MNVPVRAFLKDTLASLISGLSGPKDKSRSLYYIVDELTRAQLDAMYRTDWIARKIVRIPAEDATREWRQWQAENDQIEAIETVERAHQIPQKLTQALVKSRLYGGAALVLGVDGTGLPHDELDLERVQQDSLKFVHVVSRYDLTCQDGFETDLMSPYYGRPKMYTRQILQGNIMRIHPSRVIALTGEEHPDSNLTQSNDGWGDSILLAVRDAVLQAGTVAQSTATLLEELKIDILKIEGLTETLGDEEATAALTNRLNYAMSTKSNLNSLLMDKNDEWERIQQNFTSFPDVIKMYMLLASGAADIPATRMLGQSPTGLNATGESDIRNYYDKVASYQTNQLSLAIDLLDEVLVRSSLGTYDPNIFYEWSPLWQLSEQESADLAAKKAATFKIDVDTMVIPTDALRVGRENQLIEDATYPGFEQALEDSDGQVLNPAMEQQMQLMEKQAALAPEDPNDPNAPPPFAPKGGAPPPQAGAKGNPFKKKKNPFAKDAGFDPSQARDEEGKWSGGSGGSILTAPAKEQYAILDVPDDELRPKDLERKKTLQRTMMGIDLIGTGVVASLAGVPAAVGESIGTHFGMRTAREIARKKRTRDAGFNPGQARDEHGRWELVGEGGSHIGPLEKHTNLREYTPKEMDWEYDREYMRYTRPSFPDAFASREDFQAQYDAAPIVHLSLEELHNLGNSMASAAYGQPSPREWMEEEFGHRRDVGRIYRQMEGAGIPPPIVLAHETGLHLMAGQTRLAAALAEGKTMPVKLIPVQRKKRRNIIDTHVHDAGYDEDQPRDDKGLWVQTVAALRELRRKHRKTVLLGAVGAGIVAGTVLGLA